MKLQAQRDHIVQWLTHYAQNARVKGFVIGVSGGIDSATTSTLCALTGLDVAVVNMPIHQEASQYSRGQQHIHWLCSTFSNVTALEVPLTEVFETFIAAQPSVRDTDKALQLLAAANSRARLRMTTLYYTAQSRNALVAGTGNKVEDFGVGFYTKYGDGGVDLSPIADLNKTEVTALGNFLGVSQEIVNAPPTDGLWGDDRTDEDQIGATYPELEWAMEQHQKHLTTNAFTGRQREVYETYLALHQQNLHKMLPIPVCNIPDSMR